MNGDANIWDRIAMRRIEHARLEGRLLVDENAHVLGRVVRALRRRNAWTLETLADRSDIPREWIQFLESEALSFDELTRTKVQRLARTFGEPAEVLCAAAAFRLADLPVAPLVTLVTLGRVAEGLVRIAGLERPSPRLAVGTVDLSFTGEDYVGRVTDMLSVPLIQSARAQEATSLGSALEGRDVCLLVADLTERDAADWPLAEIARAIREKREKCLLGAVLIDSLTGARAASSDPASATARLREPVEKHLDFVAAVIRERVEKKYERLPVDQARNVTLERIGDVISSLADAALSEDAANLTHFLRRSRAAVGFADAAGAQMNLRELAAEAWMHSVTDAGFTEALSSEVIVALVRIRGMACSEADAEELRQALREQLRRDDVSLHIVQTAEAWRDVPVGIDTNLMLRGTSSGRTPDDGEPERQDSTTKDVSSGEASLKASSRVA